MLRTPFLPSHKGVQLSRDDCAAATTGHLKQVRSTPRKHLRQRGAPDHALNANPFFEISKQS